MSFIVARLLGLLSEENVRYLDTLLTALTQKKGSPVFTTLWSWFERQYPNQPNAVDRAWRTLSALQKIVEDYRFGPHRRK